MYIQRYTTQYKPHIHSETSTYMPHIPTHTYTQTHITYTHHIHAHSETHTYKCILGDTLHIHTLAPDTLKQSLHNMGGGEEGQLF